MFKTNKLLYNEYKLISYFTRRPRNPSVTGNIITISGSNNLKNTEGAEKISHNGKTIYTRKNELFRQL